MALINKIPNILNFINKNEMRIAKARKKLDIYEGELLPYVEEALRNELNPQAFERARKRLAPINFLPKVVNKLSQLYSNEIERNLDSNSATDIELFDYYVDELSINESGMDNNRQLNLNKYTAWEIYINSKNEPRLRVLPANQFLVYSDDMEDPTNPTTFIKMLGFYDKDTGMIDEKTEQAIIRQVAIYKLFDDESILVIDSDGEIRTEFMSQNPEGINPYGVIPFVYVRNGKYSLLPHEDTSDIPMITLIPLLLTDLNYATQFMSHSIIYSIDADISNPSGNPDSIWQIKSDITPDGENNSRAEIGTIDPKVDIEKVITLIQTELALWLDSKDLKAQGVGKLEASNLASGISKMIDEADTTKAIKSQLSIYQKAENELFRKLSIIHNIWVDQGLLSGTDINKKFTKELDVTTTFEQPQVVTNEKERIETLKLKEEAGYISHKKAISMANPDLSEKEIEELMNEIEKEIEENRTFTLVTEERDNDGRDQENEEETTQEESEERRNGNREED